MVAPRTAVLVGALVVWLVTTAATTTSQGPAAAPPAEAMQLEVLPKTWTRAQVDLVMEAFNTSLGVDCDYCHVIEEGGPPVAPGEKPRLDYASDEKQEKAVSRTMIRMVMAINEDLEDEIVSCYTCHHGKSTPPFSPATGWGRGRFTFSPKGPTVPAPEVPPGTAPPTSAP